MKKDSSKTKVELIDELGQLRAQVVAQGDLTMHTQRLAMHIEHTPLGVIEWDTDFKVTAWNPAAERIFGYTCDEAMGRHARDLIVPEAAGEHVDEVWRELISGKGGQWSVNENRTKNGEARICEWCNTTLVDDAGTIIGAASLVHDITERERAEEAVRNESERAQTYLNLASVMFVAMDAAGTVTLANRRACEVIGCGEEQIVGKNWFDTFLPQRLRETVKSVSKQLLRGEIEPAEYYENPILTNSGSERIIAWHNTVLRDDEGAIIGHISSGEDITDRKQAEEDRERSRVFMQTVIDGFPEALMVINRDYTIALANRASCEISEETDPVAACLKCHHVSHGHETPCGGTEHPCPLEMVVASKAPVTVEHIHYDAEGNKIPVEIIAAPIFDEKGQVVQIIESYRDITDRKRSEEAIADQARFPSENPYPVLRIASDGTILYANPAATSLLADQGQSTDGQAPDDWGQCAALAMESGTIERREFQYDESIFAFRFVPFADAEYVNVYGMDITELKRLESQFLHAQKMEAVGRLAAGVAHDFNNQLQVVLGYCDILMMDRHPGDPLWDPIVQVRQAAERARSTTSHLLAFSRRQILKPELVDVAELLHEMEKPVGRMIGEDVTLVIAIAPGVWPLLIDRSGLHQVLMNLAVNARDAMPSGGKLVIQGSNVTLDAEQAAEYAEAAAGDYVLLEVIDSGVGMDAETLENLFEPFFTTKEQGKGTGLGMPMVQGFVGQSEGSIRIDSRPGQGTTVQILLPQAPASTKALETDHAPLQIEKVETGVTILVVEDEQGVRSFLARLLEHAGYSVLEAGMPSEALELIQGDGPRPDLIVSDVIMPEMRGDELAEKMLSICKSLRFLFISGYGDIDVGGHDIMRKPFKSKELLERVRMALPRDL